MGVESALNDDGASRLELMDACAHTSLPLRALARLLVGRLRGLA
jgi:hypothetical protein